MNRTDTLRLNGYNVVDSQGRIACRAGVEVNAYGIATKSDTPRYEQTFVALISIEVARESKDARALVDQLIEAADSPRCIVGRRKNGSATIVFKCGSELVGKRVEEFGTRDRTVRFSIAVLSENATLDISDYSWIKDRSPLEVERDRLPTLTDDVPKLINSAAEKLGCVSWEMVERLREDEESRARLVARIASGEFRELSPREQAEADEEQLVADNEGKQISDTDGIWASIVVKARRAVAARKAHAELAVSP